MTDAAAGEGDGTLADAAAAGISEPNVEGLSGQVKTVSGHPVGGAPQHGVGLGAAVGAEDVEGTLGVAEADIDVIQDVEQLGVDDGDVLGAEVSQEPVELVQGGALIAVTDAIGYGDLFVGVKMAQGEDAWLLGGGPGDAWTGRKGQG